MIRGTSAKFPEKGDISKIHHKSNELVIPKKQEMTQKDGFQLHESIIINHVWFQKRTSHGTWTYLILQGLWTSSNRVFVGVHLLLFLAGKCFKSHTIHVWHNLYTYMFNKNQLFSYLNIPYMHPVGVVFVSPVSNASSTRLNFLSTQRQKLKNHLTGRMPGPPRRRWSSARRGCFADSPGSSGWGL